MIIRQILPKMRNGTPSKPCVFESGSLQNKPDFLLFQFWNKLNIILKEARIQEIRKNRL